MHKIRIVGVVHRHYQVKVEEVERRHRTCPVRQHIASSGGSGAHSSVREIALMSGICPGGVDEKIPRAPLGIDNRLKHALSRRRTADIPEAHEKNLMYLTVFHTIGQRMTILSMRRGIEVNIS